MPYSKVVKASKAYSAMAQTVAVPALHKPMRVPTYPSPERTAVLGFTNTGTLATGNNDSAYAFIVRSPTYPLWVSVNLTTPTFSHYFWSNTTAQFRLPLVVGESLTFTELIEHIGSTTSTTSPFISYPLGIDISGRKWVYVPAGHYFAFSITVNNMTAANYYLQYEYVTGLDVTDIKEGNAPGSLSSSVINFGALSSTGGWYRPINVTPGGVCTSTDSTIVSFRIGTISNGTIATPTAGASGVILVPFSAPPEMTNSVTPYQSTRATAVGVLFQNVTAIVNKEGTVTAGRLTSMPDIQLYKPSMLSYYINSIAPGERYFGALEHGLYSFALPDARTEDFRCGTEKSTGTPLFHIDGFAYVNMIVFSDLDSTAGTTLAITLDRHLEFRTTSALFSTALCLTPLEDWHRAQLACAQIRPFHENPVHLAAIAKMALSAAKSLAPIVKPVLYEMGRAGLAKAAQVFSSRIAGSMKQNPIANTPPPPKLVVTKRPKVKRVAKGKNGKQSK